MGKPLEIPLDRSKKTSLAEQIRLAISVAIDSGVLRPGARLPSWRDLAAQLGVARGTVKGAYELLLDAQLIESSRSRGTRVAARPAKAVTPAAPTDDSPLPSMYQDYVSAPAVFQMGVPSPDLYPAKLFSRLQISAARAEASSPAVYPDPRGDLELRREIAAYLAFSRGIECRASQVLITNGFSGALALIARVLRIEGRTGWVEDPGFPNTRRALQFAGTRTVPVPVDEEGIDVAFAIQSTPDATFALVTPGQQAPLGPTLSVERRVRLLEWAAAAEAWIIEDDYLGELQLSGRAAPALASIDRAGRVIYVGSFSKTIGPRLRLGFVVVPPMLLREFGEAAVCYGPAPGPIEQRATAQFMREGHYLRHLRRTKRAYAAQRDALATILQPMGYPIRAAGLAMLLELPKGARDTLIAREGLALGIAPAPLSIWYCTPESECSGLLLGIATAREDQLGESCARLHELIDRYASN
ncbi:MocR-like pyridoxine biosynthesis transcription factor PdxR [Dyella flagellata]|nr:PLP-dependent aminotransferase family protein [Dyella flagellata]